MEDSKQSTQNSITDIKQADFSLAGQFAVENAPKASPADALLKKGGNISSDNIDFLLIEAVKKMKKKNGKKTILAFIIFAAAVIFVYGGMYYFLTLLARWPG